MIFTQDDKELIKLILNKANLDNNDKNLLDKLLEEKIKKINI